MPILSIIFTILFAIFTNTSLANPTQNPTEKTTIKAQKPKFHKPETEAEMDLDEILRVESSHVGEWNDSERFTKKFIEEKTNQRNCNKCINKNGVPKSKMETWLFIGPRYTKAGYNFFYFTEDSRDDISLITFKSVHGKECKAYHNRDPIFHNVAMKKEDGKWKIDGFCSWSLNINHEYCFISGIVIGFDL